MCRSVRTTSSSSRTSRSRSRDGLAQYAALDSLPLKGGGLGWGSAWHEVPPLHDRLHPAQPRPGRPGDAGRGAARLLDVPLCRRSGRQHGRPGSLPEGARRACRAARPQRPDPDPVRQFRGRHGARRIRHVLPPGAAGEGPAARARAGDRRARPPLLAVCAGLRDRARRLRGDQPARHRRQRRDVALAGRRQPADLPDRHRPHLPVRRRAALAALVRARRRRPARLVVDRPARPRPAANR